METALLVIAVILAACSLIVTLFLAFKRGHGTTQSSLDPTLKALSERTEACEKYAEYTARAVENLGRSTEARLGFIQKSLGDDIKYIVDSNAQNLERIRRTVDEKLTNAVDGKLSDSYARISERLERMYESVGEMRTLSESVADIHRVFSNVKLRGTWGEAQLDALLSDMLAAGQYERSCKVNPLSGAMVDFAVRLPSKDGSTIYLPIDSKFPVEEFDRLISASERADRAAAAEARKNLERAVKVQADSIAKKYILPPYTTDFALMYLPSEGLYSEVMRTEGLDGYLRARRIVPCGPTNLGALLSVLQTGFRTAAIEKRSDELRLMLDGFRHDFAKFAELLDKTRKKLAEAQEAVESAEKRKEAIGRKLESFRGSGEFPTPPDEEG